MDTVAVADPPASLHKIPAKKGKEGKPEGSKKRKSRGEGEVPSSKKKKKASKEEESPPGEEEAPVSKKKRVSQQGDSPPPKYLPSERPRKHVYKVGLPAQNKASPRSAAINHGRISGQYAGNAAELALGRGPTPPFGASRDSSSKEWQLSEASSFSLNRRGSE